MSKTNKEKKEKENPVSKTELLMELALSPKKSIVASRIMLLQKHYPDGEDLIMHIKSDIKKIFKKFKSKKNLKKLTKVVNNQKQLNTNVQETRK